MEIEGRRWIQDTQGRSRKSFITSLEWEMRGRRETPVLPVAGMVMPLTNINGNMSRRTDLFSEDGEFELFVPG